MNRTLMHVLAMSIVMICLSACASKSLVQYQQPFISDGCSRFPDADWYDCCLAHDVAYWLGGDESLRLQADETLMQCVADAGYPLIADMMFAGVRLGGVPYFATPYRWGYGQIAVD